MRWNEIINEDQDFIACPFNQSKYQNVMYHGSNAKGIRKFKRSPAGLWFSSSSSWGARVYGNNLADTYACYIDVRNPYMPTSDEVDEYYGEMDELPKFFAQLKDKGYDAYFQGGESDSLAVFDNVSIVDARTGNPM